MREVDGTQGVDTLYWMRESELKHGRIAQLAGLHALTRVLLMQYPILGNRATSVMRLTSRGFVPLAVLAQRPAVGRSWFLIGPPRTNRPHHVYSAVCRPSA